MVVLLVVVVLMCDHFVSVWKSTSGFLDLLRRVWVCEWVSVCVCVYVYILIPSHRNPTVQIYKLNECKPDHRHDSVVWEPPKWVIITSHLIWVVRDAEIFFRNILHNICKTQRGAEPGKACLDVLSPSKIEKKTPQWKMEFETWEENYVNCQRKKRYEFSSITWQWV